MPTRIVLGLLLMGGMGIGSAHAAVPPTYAVVPQAHIAAPSFHAAGLAGPAVIGGPAKSWAGVVPGKPIMKQR